jgi:hypothetical protein
LYKLPARENSGIFLNELGRGRMKKLLLGVHNTKRMLLKTLLAGDCRIFAVRLKIITIFSTTTSGSWHKKKSPSAFELRGFIKSSVYLSFILNYPTPSLVYRAGI